MSAGLGAANIRLVGRPDPELPDPAEVIVEMAGPEADIPEMDENDKVVSITHGDGSVTVSLTGAGLGTPAAANDGPEGWFDNLASKISASELSGIADDLIRAIDTDITSRKDWIDGRAQGIKLLGLQIELPQVQGATEGAPVEGMSKVRHPLLQEAVLRFQANARSELLPTDGPVKIRNDDNDAKLKEDQLANAFERDMNHYLTVVAKEYYPDTDRMLLMLGFGGTTFKKVYFCPLRNRPVSESVDAEDIIVNQNAIDLGNARRVTHRTYLRPSTVKRLQILGVYRDIELPDAIPPQQDAQQIAEKEQQGLSESVSFDPDERDREIYEIDCELNLPGYEHKHKGRETGLQIPYTVTLDRSSREVLSVTRNYEEADKTLPTARERYVKFTFVPGLGFYDIGLLHILGNTTNAVTAAWREMLDNGMYANFPGFLMAKGGTRQNTNIFRVPPGGGAQVDTNGQDIRSAIMPLPYSTQGMPALMDLVENMVQTGQRVGGTAEMQVGEGRGDAPVGTTMALIDQAVKVMNAVHKRLFSAQAREFQLLVKVFREHPDSFWMKKCRSKTEWDVEKFNQAVNSCELVPQADPNTASSGQRLMKIQGLFQLMQAAPQLYDPVVCHAAALQAMGWTNPDEFMVPKAARAAPPPSLQQMQAEMANKKAQADADTATAQAKLMEAKASTAETQEKISSGALKPKQEGVAAQPPPPDPETNLDRATAEAKLTEAHTHQREVAVKEKMAETEDRNRDQDREAKELEAVLGLAKDVIIDPQDAAGAGKKAVKIKDQIEKGIKE